MEETSSAWNFFCSPIKSTTMDRLVSSASLDFEGPQLTVRLHNRICKLAPDEALGIENCVLRVPCNLVLRCVADQTLRIRECNIGRSCAVALVIGDDLDPIILPNANAGVRGA